MVVCYCLAKIATNKPQSLPYLYPRTDLIGGVFVGPPKCWHSIKHKCQFLGALQSRGVLGVPLTMGLVYDYSFCHVYEGIPPPINELLFSSVATILDNLFNLQYWTGTATISHKPCPPSFYMWFHVCSKGNVPFLILQLRVFLLHNGDAEVQNNGYLWSWATIDINQTLVCHNINSAKLTVLSRYWRLLPGTGSVVTGWWFLSMIKC